MLISFVYQIALFFLALVAFPKFLYQCIIQKKYRHSFLERLGLNFPDIKKDNKPLIWIHAVSVGETRAVSKLAKELKARLDNPILLISSITETGHAEAKRGIPEADYHIYLPFDFLWIIRPIIVRSAPEIVILCETDFWYNFLNASKAVGARTIVVNAKISERSAHRFRRMNSFSKALFSLIDLFCVQSEHYKSRFESLGIPPEKLVVTGNLKFDEDPAKLGLEELSSWKAKLGIGEKDKILVIGSTHDPEERMLLAEIDKVWKAIPELKVILVPRHPERFLEVASLLRKLDIPFARYSEMPQNSKTAKIVLIDQMGVLRKCYQIADAAIVAGSYTEKVGGHNILEPMFFGVPVIFGPHMHSQPELEELVNDYGAGRQVSLDQLEKTLENLLYGRDAAEDLRQAGAKLISSTRGSANRTFEAIFKKGR